MGRLIEGRWSTEWYSADEKGRFVRDATVFRNRVTRDGSSGHRAEAGRYHLYVSLACPWAHRTLIARHVQGLAETISLSIVHPHMGDQGWSFEPAPGTIPDELNGASYLYQVYTRAKPDYTGRVTVPVLWDKAKRTIVSNESREILRMLSREFDAFATSPVELCPKELERAIDAEIDAMYSPVNNGVYRAGFASSQAAYDEAVTQLFEALDGYEQRLSGQRYLLGDRVTEADICLVTTLLRFDVVYHYHFKCNVRKLEDHPALSGYVRDLYQSLDLGATTNFAHIKQHYYTSHPHVNPTGIVPRGPEVDFERPHDRHQLSATPR